MTQKRLYPHWREMVVLSETGPQPQMLLKTKAGRAMIAGLQAGQKVPPHPEGPAIYHFLEGSGHMIVGEESYPVQTGATVVVPDGTPRGIQAETQLAFLAVRVAQAEDEARSASMGDQAAMQGTKWKPFIKFGPVIMFGLMIGAMIINMIMLSGGGGTAPGMWGAMILPALGMLIMLVVMFFVFRRMAGRGGPMSEMMGHGGSTPGMMGHHHTPQPQSDEPALTTVNYDLPAVHCIHCKARIESEVSQLPGVSSVSVDVDTKQAAIQFGSPATETEIEALLAGIGYPPANQ